MSDELCFTAAHELARQIATKRLSPVTLINAVIARAERLQPQLNCLAVESFDEAREKAKQAENDVVQGRPLGLLHGVPITIKDGVATAGHRLPIGSFAFENNVATTDVLAAARIKSAGAIIVGKTTTPECYHKVLTDSPLFGVTHNPWALDHTPGGSSGGAAAALAAGIAPLAVGTDGGGSIRCPAACTGILGLKPTLGRIPMEAAPDSFACYSFAGPMARNVRDLALLASVMEGNAGHDVHAQRTSREQLVSHEPADAVRGLRVGWIPRFRQFRVDTEVAAAAQAAVERLEADGSVVEILPDTTLDNVFDTYVVIATTAHAARFGGLIDQLGDRLTPSLRELILQGRSYSAIDLQRAADRRTSLFRRVQDLFARLDLLVTPTLTAPAKRLDAGGAINTPLFAEWASALYPFNLTGHPAASVPCGFTAHGLPIGLQLVAPWDQEARIHGVAGFFEAVTPWAHRRPPV